MPSKRKIDIKRKWQPSPNTGKGIYVRLNPQELKTIKVYAKVRRITQPEALRRLAFLDW